MGLLNIVRKQLPITEPGIVELASDELIWPELTADSVLVPAIESPDISDEHVLGEPRVNDIECLKLPIIVEASLLLLKPDIQIVDLLDPLKRPVVNGSIYVKKEQQLQLWGEKTTKTRIEPLNLQQKLDPREPKGLDIFELLLPILMPPATTEFREELLFPAELYPFQRAGVKWLFEKDIALLADDMGLGKTVQCITAFRALIRRSMALTALVICPKSILTNWERELNRWAPELIAVRIQGTSQVRRLAWLAYPGKCHVLIATYETVRQDRDLLKGRSFDLIVTDEVQRIKNPDAAVSRVIREVGQNSRRRWGLTGTPLENRLEDTAAIFGFLSPGLFGGSEVLWPRLVRERIAPYMLRRRKKEALPDLPDKVVDTKILELTDGQRRLYEQAESRGVNRLRETRDVTVPHVLALIQELKQICDFDPVSGESCKMDFLLEDYLETACSDNQKAIIISQYVKSLSEISDRLKSFNPLMYTGKLSSAQRDAVEQIFNTKDTHQVLLLSLKAGGVGLNLERANYVLHFDRWWNPAVERQAEDRTHRIGQERTVFVTRLICINTIEERIEQLLERKKILFQEVVDELADVQLERILSEEELFGLFNLTAPRRVKQESEKTVVKGQKVNASQIDQRDPVVIRPEEPYSNIVRLRQILSECEEYIWWADLHFSARGLEELSVTIDPALVRQVRILSGPANIDRRARRDFRRFNEELAHKGIDVEWRVLQGFSHDRFIISANSCYNVPPINSILRGQYSEILQTPNQPPFAKWWHDAIPIDESQ